MLLLLGTHLRRLDYTRLYWHRYTDGGQTLAVLLLIQERCRYLFMYKICFVTVSGLLIQSSRGWVVIRQTAWVGLPLPFRAHLYSLPHLQVPRSLLDFILPMSMPNIWFVRLKSNHHSLYDRWGRHDNEDDDGRMGRTQLYGHISGVSALFLQIELPDLYNSAHDGVGMVCWMIWSLSPDLTTGIKGFQTTDHPPFDLIYPGFYIADGYYCPLESSSYLGLLAESFFSCVRKGSSSLYR